MKKLPIILSAFLLVFGLGSCNKDCDDEILSEPTSLVLSPEAVTLKVGETQQLTATVEPLDQAFTVTFASDNEQVAKVDTKGLVTAVAEGTAKVTASVGKFSKECLVTVTKTEDDGGGSTTSGNELPLLKFDIESDDDADVVAHENKIGRVIEDVLIEGQGPFAGFVNRDLTIPVAVYGLGFNDGTKVIVAFGKETLDNCPKTMEMLAEYGFTNLEEAQFSDGTPLKHGVKDDDETISVQLLNSEEPDYGASLQIRFLQTPPKQDIEIAHPVIPSAKDFPDYKTFTTGDATKIADFESNLGLREYFAEQSDEAKKNLMFITKEASMAQSNFQLVYYVSTPTGGGPFINSVVNFIRNANDFDDPKLQEWFKTNGYGKDFVSNSQQGFAYAYDDATGKILAQIFISQDGSMAMLQIFEDTETQSAAQMRSLAMRQYKTMQAHKIFKQHKLHRR